MGFAHAARAQQEQVLALGGEVALSRFEDARLGKGGDSGEIELLSSILFSVVSRFSTIMQADLFLAVSPPLQLAAAAVVLGWVAQRSVMLVIKDLVPEAALSVGMMRRGRLYEMAERLERWVYERASHIVVISEQLASHVRDRGGREQAASVLPDWVDPALLQEARPDPEWRGSLGIPATASIAPYSGNLGAKQDFDLLIEAAATIDGQPSKHLVLIGADSERDRLDRLVRERWLPNVHLLPLQPRERIPVIQQSADLLLLPERLGAGATVLPPKLLTYLAAGRPVLALTDEGSGAALALEESHAGVVVHLGDLEGFMAAWQHLVRGARAERVPR
ncbi:MAG: glycosyltransferase [Chloroflexi bacterium]|nr:glycosyltransferase [Chloroflexota bacterium]